MTVAFEATLLRNYMIKPYEQPNVSIDMSEVTRLRNDANQKELNTDAIIRKYQNLLNRNELDNIDELEEYIEELEKHREELQKTREKYKKV